MELFLEDATSFKKLVDGVAVLVSEAEFIISKEGLSLKATDPSQISLVDFNLPKKAFKEYKVKLHTLTDFKTILKEARNLGVLNKSEVKIISDWFNDPSSWAKKHGFESNK